MTDTHRCTFANVKELGIAYRSGKLTPLRVAEAALARLDALEPYLNAVIDPMRELALRTAEDATHELRAGRDRGPLHGIPVAIKDLIDIAGVPTTYATRAVRSVLPDTDAILIRHLREAGAVLLGKTNLLEFAYGVAHPDVGQTNNPWDVTRTSGGSSGGSAALVAAGVVPLAVGTDTGGSIRIPASYCGVVGLKPSYGLVATEGVFPLSWSLDHAGPIARSVSDAATLLSGLTGKKMVPTDRPMNQIRIGMMAAHLESGLVTPGVRDMVSVAINRLAEGGAKLVPITSLELDAVNSSLLAVLLPEAALIHEQIFKNRPEGYAAGTRAQIEAGMTSKGIEYVRAQRLRIRLREAVQILFDDVDCLLSPAVSFVAPLEDPALEGDGGDGEMLSSGLANMTGHPALSLPCGMSGGLPVGIQLIGPLNRDLDLLSVAASIEACLSFSERPRL
jgi:aspartyl-tRNA(Asn)/glutamyl-tRNA(Gln) amidotransferase subunit A